jgi:hypothetical protein
LRLLLLDNCCALGAFVLREWMWLSRRNCNEPTKRANWPWRAWRGPINTRGIRSGYGVCQASMSDITAVCRGCVRMTRSCWRNMETKQCDRGGVACETSLRHSMKHMSTGDHLQLQQRKVWRIVKNEFWKPFTRSSPQPCSTKRAYPTTQTNGYPSCTFPIPSPFYIDLIEKRDSPCRQSCNLRRAAHMPGGSYQQRTTEPYEKPSKATP